MLIIAHHLKLTIVRIATIANILVLGEGSTFGVNERFGSAEKKFSINFSKANTKFCLSLHCNADNKYLFVNGKVIFKFKADSKNVNFPTQFCLRSIVNRFSATEFFQFYLSILLINMTY